jgi:hypothetical protein
MLLKEQSMNDWLYIMDVEWAMKMQISRLYFKPMGSASYSRSQ